MLVRDDETNDGAAVRTLHAIRQELAALDDGAPAYGLRALKGDERSRWAPSS
jgi:hypothetical protein